MKRKQDYPRYIALSSSNIIIYVYRPAHNLSVLIASASSVRLRRVFAITQSSQGFCLPHALSMKVEEIPDQTLVHWPLGYARMGVKRGFCAYAISSELPCGGFYILTSTKNASLIITEFLAMVYKNEKPRTASLCRGRAMLENDLNFICRCRVILMTSYRLSVHMT